MKNSLRLRHLMLVLVPLAASCSAPGTVSRDQAARTEEPAVVARAPAQAASVPQTLEHYKRAFALRIVQGNRNVFEEPLPKMLKSVVVLDVTIDREGHLASVSVRRSNGYKDLERVAMNSVREAAPFVPPARSLGRRDGSVNFLETFLFRDDGRFQVRTLAEAQS